MDVKKLLDELRPQFDVNAFSQSTDVESASSSTNQTEWSEKFQQEYVIGSAPERDDLLFFVKRTREEEEATVEVLRKTSKLLPKLSDRNVLWDQTFYLNLILHEFEYHVTCAVMTVDPVSECVDDILMKISQQVYPSPIQRRMDKKGDCDVVYPNIMFCIDNFEEVFSSLHASCPGQRIAVQLVAINKRCSINQLVFLGALKYSILLERCEAEEQPPSFGSRFKRFSLLSKHRGKVSAKTYHFVKLRGPFQKGYAEMAILKREAEASSDCQDTDDDSADFASSDSLGAASSERRGSQCSQELRYILKLDPPVNETVDSTQSSTSANANNGITSPEARTNTSEDLSCSIDQQQLTSSNGDFDQKHVEFPRHLLSGQDAGISNSVDYGREIDSTIEACSNGHSACNDERTAQANAAATELDSSDFRDSPTGVHDAENKRKKAKGFKKLSKIIRKRQSPDTHSPLSVSVFSYLTYIQLPWYYLVEDILNNTKEQVFQI